MEQNTSRELNLQAESDKAREQLPKVYRIAIVAREDSLAGAQMVGQGQRWSGDRDQIDSQWEFAMWFRELKPGLCNNLEGWDGEGDEREGQEGGDIRILMADSCWCLAETNTILQRNYPLIKTLKHGKKINYIERSSYLSKEEKKERYTCLED